jgi:ATP-dependent DNA helicase RecG
MAFAIQDGCFSAPHYAKFIIENDRMYTWNANRAVTGEAITPDNFEVNIKILKEAGLIERVGATKSGYWVAKQR